MSAYLAARQAFSPSCPSGGTWWACGYGTYFVGCCARDPCDITCAQGNLYPGAFDPKAYGTFPDATCGTGSKFYTCTAGQTFWGCCKTNPCAQSGCPDGDLEPAILNRDDLRSAYHATGSATTSSTSGPSAEAKKSDDGVPVGAIAGGAAGGAFAIAAIIGIIVWWLCLRRKKKAKAKAAEHYGETNGDGLPVNGMSEFHNKHYRNQSSDSPPSYTSPNPNHPNGFYNPSTTHTYQHNYDPSVAAHNYTTPQELPISTPTTPQTPAQFRTHKSMYSHARGPSELSGDEPRNELDSGSPASPELSGSSTAVVSPASRKWSWDDNKEKVDLATQYEHPHEEADMIGVAVGEPRAAEGARVMPVWREHTLGEVRRESEGDGGDGREEEQQMASRGRATPQGLGFIEILDDMAERRGEMDTQRVETRR
ncbi:hypothetical protein COCHEDRAFT_1178187 [Bipolaris maydis C5]|uniref:Uncharacterized protein n=1 Tax=Cochliobolus heterostrophus (strain C5 / ATCC 48332 / race O) TaxID=701091 RepID=M2SX92_COCH5|nr:hypothetical protein COCHEDRAFT_1178187 [Bipolaris maydis C5]KAJ5025336.1 hypothetical protein J3E73DRAFT_382458 [Bipolaris maydis]KAJ6196922.1 hypothetical protein J3E72DRAFT_47482 [Bipolaris maydis]KAJ6207812.1 hypothetical protein PSV09DRAFT_1178187 [Bipolaris maydis]KAJ6280634.1 hypothetical protein J3E71DRAFT_354336 [Bipolaris maydis]